MDKNFIKIDDLLRQRLGGGEETERSGSWLNMRELLDKEMPQEKPAGILYWRRTFGVVAALSLLATIGIGGYELSSSFKGLGMNSDRAVADIVSGKVSNNASKGNEVGDVYQLQEAGAADRSSASEMAASEHSSPAHKSAANSNANANTKSNVNTVHPAANNINANDKRTAHTRTQNGNTTQLPDHKTATVNDNGKHIVANEINKLSAHHNTTVTTPAQVTAATPVASVPVANRHDNSNTNPVGTRATAPANRIADSKTDEKQSANSVLPVTAGVKTTRTEAANNVNVDKLALGSNTSVGASRNTSVGTAVPVTMDKTIDRNTAAGTGSKLAGTDVNAITPAGLRQKGADGTAQANSAKPANPVKMTLDNAAMKNVSAANISKGKKVIERMVLHERFVKTSPNEGYFKLDTISVETLITELGLNSDNSRNYSYTRKAAGKPNATANGKTGGNQAREDEAVENSSTLMPAATLNLKANTNLKAANAGQKSAGSKTVEKLNAVFNDIKYKFGSPKFQPGITAGVNGTFFGPNSFKGFQFGFAGNLVFNDQWSIMSELKYFHRVNGNTSIDDSYNTYTPVSGGQFAKQQQLNSYSFSALHSLEMPISIRYCMGNFNFFAGGNLVYNFSINTGAETIPVASNPVIVATQGADNAPKLSEQDFSSRFGLGYLMGLSYNVGANTKLDLRSVQTVWENTNTTGAKMISSQLYKSPSLQLSIIYRIGGNRNRE